MQVENELSVVEKEMSEHFIEDIIFELADYFLCVVNDFTSLDQRYLDKLTRNLQNSTKVFREVIVVHNCKARARTRSLSARRGVPAPSTARGALLPRSPRGERRRRAARRR